MAAEATRQAEIELELRVTLPAEHGKLAGVLKILVEEGRRLHAYLVYRLEEELVGLFVCERPAEAALALQEKGFTVETETVVTVRSENRPGAVGHLVHTLEVEGIGIGYSYAAARGGSLYAVLSTDDNPRAEDILRRFLLPGDRGPSASS